MRLLAIDAGTQSVGACYLDEAGTLHVYGIRPRGKAATVRRLRLGRLARAFDDHAIDLLALEFAPLRGADKARTNGWLGMSAGIWHTVPARRVVYVNATWKRSTGVNAQLKLIENVHRIAWPVADSLDALGVLLRAQADLYPSQRTAIERVEIMPLLR